MKPIAVLGVGPAGLMAAHAVALSGRPVALFSKGTGVNEGESATVQRSRLGGAQFLHHQIPVVCGEPDAIIGYKLLGTAEGYQKKVYGDTRVPFVSMQFLEDGDTTDAWSLQAAYDKLWNLLSADSANIVDISPEWIANAIAKEWFDGIISTIPAPAICNPDSGHLFPSQEIRIANEAMHGWSNMIVYNGEPDVSWTRSSNLFGYGSTEWNASINPSLSETFVVRKPLRTNCDCWAQDVCKLGRYGAWTKGILTHHAFEGARSFVESL